MGLLQDFKDLVNEHGSSTVMRERLLLMNDKAAAMDKENKDLREEVARLTAELAQLHTELVNCRKTEEFTEHRGGLFKRRPAGGYHETVYCPQCRLPMGFFEATGEFHCDPCMRQTSFRERSLEKVISRLP